MISNKITGVLPLKITGRHYVDNLSRCDLLFSTVRHFGLASLFAEIIIIVPNDERDIVCHHAAAWPDIPIRIVAEGGLLDVFQEYAKIYQVRPWHRQQIIKLFSATLVSTPFFLTLDPDVMAVRSFGYDDLIRDGRALIEPEPRTAHADWWRASASLLGLDPMLDKSGMSVTPALISSDICRALMQRLTHQYNKEWYRVLLENYIIDWTEYTLYFLFAESNGMLHQLHRLPGENEPRLLAPYRVWRRADLDVQKLVGLFAVPQRDFFTVVQSNSGVSASQIARLIAPYVPVKMEKAETIAAKPGDKARELTGAAMRKIMGRLRRLH